MTSNAQRAEILVQALPYIQQYNGQIVVIKYGGNAMVNEELKHAVMRDIVLLSLVGVKVVLLHGGGPEITEMLGRVGKESRFVADCASPTARRRTSCRWCSPARSTRGLSTFCNPSAGAPWACAAWTAA